MVFLEITSFSAVDFRFVMVVIFSNFSMNLENENKNDTVLEIIKL